MRALIVVGILGAAGLAWWQMQEPVNELRLKSSDPQSPQSVGVPPKVIDPQGPAPKLYIDDKPQVKAKQSEQNLPKLSPAKPKQVALPKGPEVLKSGKINPDAVEYYRKRGYLGAGQEALAVLKSQPEIWSTKDGDPLHFEDVSGGLSVKFEINQDGLLNGAVVEMSGGGAGARLMSAEMVLTGMKPWDLHWETQAPGPVAGTIPVKDSEELHYYCDMQSMDESGALNEPSRCHFMMNEPTPELQAYLKQSDAPPIQKAHSRMQP